MSAAHRARLTLAVLAASPAQIALVLAAALDARSIDAVVTALASAPAVARLHDTPEQALDRVTMVASSADAAVRACLSKAPFDAVCAFSRALNDQTSTHHKLVSMHTEG